MESPITHSIASVLQHLTIVDQKLASLLKINQNETLKSVQAQIPSLRKLLQSLSTQVHSPNATLKEIKSQNGTLLSFIVQVVVCTSSTIKTLQSNVKSVKHKDAKKGGLFEKHYKPVTETDLLIIKEKMYFLEAVLRVISQLITMKVALFSFKQQFTNHSQPLKHCWQNS